MNEEIHGWVLDRIVGPDPHLTQGDLIVFKESKDPMQSAGIVVTADCDLKNRKHAHLVTLVPLVSVKVTMERYLLLEACEDQRNQIINYACRKNKIDPTEDPLIIEAKIQTVADSFPEGTPERIAVDFILRKQEHITAKQYSDLMNAIGSKPKAAPSFEKKLLNKGDILVLPTTKDLGLDVEIAWIRYIWQIPIGQIAMKTSEIQKYPGERIARLDSPYRYRLTQIMAQVFSDIGLPNNSKKFENDIEEVLKNA